MPYFEVKPVDEHLSSLIECFWVSHSASQPISHRILPDGCMDIIYTFPNLSQKIANPFAPVAPRIIGMMTQAAIVQANTGVDQLGIRFRPGGIFPFVKTPLHLFTNLSEQVDNVNKALGSAVYEQLIELSTWQERIEKLETHLIQQLRNVSYPVPMGLVIRQIIQERGQLSIKQLSTQTTISSRQLERNFKQYVGVSPKLLSRIIRFRYITTLLKDASRDSLMGIAFTNGYTDHAHLTKEFQEFSGLQPSAYLLQ